MPNRLAASSSPYLLQHADNPVDWWEWGDDAFAEARRRDLPVLLSVGYAACHWCHVMAHESFEDAETASLMNQRFVNVKVDREERPDVDAVYMEAVQGMTGQGGWPMTVFLTADGEPFYAGTYFPPQPRHGMPSFAQVLTAIGTTWRDRREEVLTAGKSIADQLAQRATTLSADRTPPDSAALDAAVVVLAREFDPINAGFGGAPKFPPSMTLEHLLRHHARTGDADALGMVARTCDAMARGGMYDQLGGGFARYSVDPGWVVPHFEKMLYDNALLLRVYAHVWRTTAATLAARVAVETGDFLLRDLSTPQGGFASSLDADSEGVEGRSYVWTPDQLRAVLGDDAEWAVSLLTVTSAGTFEHGSSVLQLRKDPDDEQRWAGVRARLLDARRARAQPARDDKVVAAWNGLAIAALAEAGALFDRGDFVEAADAAADLLLSTHLIDGRLRRVSRDGMAGVHAGVLEDYADVAEGLLTLYAVTGQPSRLHQSGALLDVVRQRFGGDSGEFYDTAEDAERLLRRPQDPTDNATPSGWSAACGALLSYAAYTGSAAHRDAAEAGLAVYAALARRAPRFAGWGLAVAEAWADGPREAALVGDREDPALKALHRTALRGTAPGLVVAFGQDDGVPLLEGRALIDGGPAAYVCRHFACERPVTTPEELADLIGARG